MKNFYVYIDDSGSPGQLPANKFIANDTKIWTAVILSLEDKKYIDKIINHSKNIIQENFMFSEFHFTEIYSGKNDFKDINSKFRLEIFKLFVEIYNKIKPYVVVSGVGVETLKNSGFSESYIHTKKDGFNFSKPSDYALNTLLMIINQYFAENYKNDSIKIEITIDEGRQKVNTVQMLTDFGESCKELKYKSSKDVYGLQFVDFITFSINRIQNNFSKDRSNFDNEFMKIIGGMQLNSNLPSISVSDLDMLNKDVVESFCQAQERPDIEHIQYIEELSSFLSKKHSDFDKKFFFEYTRKLKQDYSKCISDEFKIELDKAEEILLNKQ